MKKISIIIPVYNEKNIEILLQNMVNSLDDNCYEIILIDTNNSSNTKNINMKNILVINSLKGRAIQMNTGVKYASTDILLFLHSDTILPQNALNDIINTFKDDNIKAGAFDLSFDKSSFILNIIAKLSSYRSRFTKIPYGDQGIFIRKDIFDSLNGYKEIALMEDVQLMMDLKNKNYQIKILDTKVITSARKWRKDGILYTTLRNWILISLYILGVDANKLAKYYK